MNRRASGCRGKASTRTIITESKPVFNTNRFGALQDGASHLPGSSGDVAATSYPSFLSSFREGLPRCERHPTISDLFHSLFRLFSSPYATLRTAFRLSAEERSCPANENAQERRRATSLICYACGEKTTTGTPSAKERCRRGGHLWRTHARAGCGDFRAWWIFSTFCGAKPAVSAALMFSQIDLEKEVMLKRMNRLLSDIADRCLSL